MAGFFSFALERRDRSREGGGAVAKHIGARAVA
jgi:hypothetical protein